MTDPITVHWDMRAPLLIEPDPAPIVLVASLVIIPRRLDSPADVLLRLRCLAPRDFEWRRMSTGEPIMVGNVRTFTRPAGFEFDLFGQAGLAGQWAAAYVDKPRDRMIITRGFYLADWS